MPLRNTKYTYGAVAKTFHWLIFLLIAGLVIIGFLMESMPNSPDKFKLIGLHKSIGITVLTLVSLRLIWKLANSSPLLPNTLNALEKLLAHAGHWALYALMFAMPLTGWAMSSAVGFPVSVFGWFTIPNLVSPDKALGGDLKYLHNTFAWVLIAMVSLHVLAALLHHFYYKDNVLTRMIPYGEKNAQNPDRIAE